MPLARENRLQQDLIAMRDLQAASTVVGFAAGGSPPDHYLVTFSGKGLSRGSAGGAMVVRDWHQADIRLGYEYPQRPPDIRFTTPIAHPNVSYSGFVNFDSIGMPWNADISLDAVCERLWDVLRGSFVYSENIVNPAAQQLLDRSETLHLPVDARPLRDRLPPPSGNIIRYERQNGQRVTLISSEPDDIFWIDENTPEPPLALRPARASDSEILYIDD